MHPDLQIVVDGVIYQKQTYGGISRLFSEILPRICAMGERISLSLLTTGRLQHSLPAHPRIVHHPLPHLERFLRPNRLWRRVAPLVRGLTCSLHMTNCKESIWHTTYFTMPLFWRGPTVVTVADMIYEKFPELFSRDEEKQFVQWKRRSVLAADAVIAISETTRRDLVLCYDMDPTRIWVTPLGCSDVFRRLHHPHLPLQQSLPASFILYVGGRAAYKNFDTLLHTYAVWDHRREVDLVVVGPRWSESEIQRLQSLGVVDCVHLLREVSDEQLRVLYDSASALVYPSLYEGFGLPLLEAMACGCPVVASRIPSTVEVAGDCPFYFAPLAIGELMAALKGALSEGRESRRTLDGQQHAHGWTWDNTAKRTLEVYRALQEGLYSGG